MIFAITVTYNSMKGDILDPFLACYLAQEGVDSRLLFIDNASTDGTRQWLQRLGDPRVDVICNDTNIGFAAACNQGIAEARRLGASHVLLINHDTEFGPRLFRDLEASMEEAGASAISPLITFYHRPDRIWYAGGSMAPLRGMITHHERYEQPVSSAPRAVFQTDFAPGCCLMLRTDLFDRVGLLDPTFFVYWEDSDFCRRMRQGGEKLVVDPAIHFRHHVSVTTGGATSDFSIRMYHRNHMLFLRKHYGRATAFAVLPVIAAKAIAKLALGRIGPRQLRLQVRALREGLSARLV